MILAGSTGAGKSHTLNLWLRLLYEQAREKGQIASVWILGRKNDSFCGLREAGKLTIFNSLDPTDACNLIESFHRKFLERLESVSEADRKYLPPLRLILEDWSSTVLILKKSYKALWTKIQIMLLDIITVGKEYNVCLLVLTQSINLEALGLVSDSNLRANMAVIVQGLLVETKDGKTKGDYLLLELTIKNQFIVSDNSQRSLFLSKVNQLIPESKEKQIPIYFSTLGNGIVGLLPFIEKTTLDLTLEERNDSLTNISIIRNNSKDNKNNNVVDFLEKIYSLEDVEDISNVSNISDSTNTKPSKQPLNDDSRGYEGCLYTIYRLDKETAQKLILSLRNDLKLNQTKIIETLWKTKPGTSKAYKPALKEYKELIENNE